MEPRILIADEDGAVRRMIARVLDVAGFPAAQAANWSELRFQLEKGEAAVLLLDLDMLEREDKGRGTPGSRRFGGVPIIGMTALPHQHKTATRWGFDFLMEKPLDLGLLLHRVQELIAKKESTGSQSALEAHRR